MRSRRKAVFRVKTAYQWIKVVTQTWNGWVGCVRVRPLELTRPQQYSAQLGTRKTRYDEKGLELRLHVDRVTQSCHFGMDGCFSRLRSRTQSGLLLFLMMDTTCVTRMHWRQLTARVCKYAGLLAFRASRGIEAKDEAS